MARAGTSFLLLIAEGAGSRSSTVGCDCPPNKTIKLLKVPVMDGSDGGRGSFGQRRSGPTDERSEDGHASTAGAGAAAPIGADRAASREGVAHRSEHGSRARLALAAAGVEGSADELPE